MCKSQNKSTLSQCTKPDSTVWIYFWIISCSSPRPSTLVAQGDTGNSQFLKSADDLFGQGPTSTADCPPHLLSIMRHYIMPEYVHILVQHVSVIVLFIKLPLDKINLYPYIYPFKWIRQSSLAGLHPNGPWKSQELNKYDRSIDRLPGASAAGPSVVYSRAWVPFISGQVEISQKLKEFLQRKMEWQGIVLTFLFGDLVALSGLSSLIMYYTLVWGGPTSSSHVHRDHSGNWVN